MTNTTNTTNTAATEITLHYPLAGAYKGHRASLKAIRSHGSIDGVTPLCPTVKTELCDLQEGAEAQADLCPACARKIAKLVAGGAILKLS